MFSLLEVGDKVSLSKGSTYDRNDIAQIQGVGTIEEVHYPYINPHPTFSVGWVVNGLKWSNYYDLHDLEVV